MRPPDIDLSRFQSEWIKALWDATSTKPKSEVFSHLYVAFWKNLNEAFQEVFPEVNRRAGPTRMAAILKDFGGEVVCSDWEIYECMRYLPAYLRNRARRDRSELWIPALADFEWSQFNAIYHPAVDFTGDPSGKTIHLNPTVQAVRFEYDIPGWLETRAELPPLDKKMYFIYRDPNAVALAAVRPAEMHEAAVLDELIEQGPVSESALIKALCSLAAKMPSAADFWKTRIDLLIADRILFRK
jgi:hypothetical protein